MKKKVFGFLLGTSFMFMLGVGIFSASVVNADNIYQIYKLDPPNNIWCDRMGDNCLPTVIIPGDN